MIIQNKLLTEEMRKGICVSRNEKGNSNDNSTCLNNKRDVFMSGKCLICSCFFFFRSIDVFECHNYMFFD